MTNGEIEYLAPQVASGARSKAREAIAMPQTLNLIETAKKNIIDILSIAFNHTDEQTCIIVFDLKSELSQILTAAYRGAAPNAVFINFDETTSENILKSFTALKPADLVILIQSTSFRLETFRIRVELFKRHLKVIEHPHLSRMPGLQMQHYVESLAYDPSYYRTIGQALKLKIDHSKICTIDTGGQYLIYNSKLESAKLNIGDYSQMLNIGGQFPIGEVFTEAQDLESVHGCARIFCFGDTSYTVNKPDNPITLIIDKGLVTNTENSTAAFEKVLQNIRADEGLVHIRELGFGMNRALTKDKIVSDIGTFERMCGVHLSLGKKHDSYVKPGFKRGESKNHIDVFLATESVNIDGENIYKDGQWTLR